MDILRVTKYLQEEIMNSYEELYELLFSYLKRFVFPEEWLAIDIAMSKQELFTLLTVGKLKEATMGQLSDHMSFPMSTATGIIDRLVKKGYMERGKSETDRRIVVISLTDKGKAFVESMKSLIISYIKKAYDVLNEEERETLFRIAEKITTSFQQLNSEKDQGKNDQNQVRKITIE